MSSVFLYQFAHMFLSLFMAGIIIVSNDKYFPFYYTKIGWTVNVKRNTKKIIFLIFRSWQYKDVYRKIMNNQHHACILEADYYSSVCNVYFKLASSSE